MAVFRKIEDLITQGFCDQRGAATCASVSSFPEGKRTKKFGVLLLTVKDEYLHIYEVDLKNNIGDRVAYLEIKRMENFILKANMLIQLLAFEYEGEYYEFTNFTNHKKIKQAFAEEREK